MQQLQFSVEEEEFLKENGFATQERGNEQAHHVLDIDERIVDGYDLNALLDGGAEHQTPNAAKPGNFRTRIKTNAYVQHQYDEKKWGN